jgi:hypothetical protein
MEYCFWIGIDNPGRIIGHFKEYVDSGHRNRELSDISQIRTWFFGLTDSLWSKDQVQRIPTPNEETSEQTVAR